MVRHLRFPREVCALLALRSRDHDRTVARAPSLARFLEAVSALVSRGMHGRSKGIGQRLVRDGDRFRRRCATMCARLEA